MQAKPCVILTCFFYSLKSSTPLQKTADVKVAENEAPKKGRGKAKVIEDDEQEVPDIDIDEKAAPPVAEKKKRGKKANGTNGLEETNGIEETAPPTKRGKKKTVEEPEDKSTNGDHSAEESNPAEDDINGDDVEEANGDTEEAQIAPAKGRKKATKAETKPKQSGRGRKPKQENVDDEKEVSEEKPKGKGRGRKAQPKAEPEPETEEKTESVEDTKVEPATKGRKKGPVKAAKEKTPESEDGSVDEPVEEKPVEEPKKKEVKGRKGQGKKAQAKEEVEEDDEEMKEEPASKKRKVNKKEDKGKGLYLLTVSETFCRLNQIVFIIQLLLIH